MKNLKKFEIKNLMKGMAFGGFVLMMAIAGVGCSKKKSGNNNPYGYWNGGYNGFQQGYGSGPIGVGYDFSGNEVVMQFGVNQQYGYQDPYFVNGPVQISGTINTQGIQCGSYQGGYVPAGQYQIYSMQPAMAQNGIVSGGQLMGQGTAQLVISLGWAHIQSPTGMGQSQQGYGPLTATLQIQSINGMPCGAMLAVQPGGY